MNFQLFIVTAWAFFFLSLSACQQKSVYQLKTEILNTAGNCSTELKKEYEREIEKLSKILENNEEKLKKALQNMLEDIKCS